MPRSTVRCALLLTLAVVSVLVAVDWQAWFVLPSHEVGDLAANALQIERCKQGVEIYGNYSRFCFNHPGPGFFYVYALGQVVLYDWLGLVPSPHNAHRLAGLCLQAFFFGLALASHVRTPLFVPLARLAAAANDACLGVGIGCGEPARARGLRCRYFVQRTAAPAGVGWARPLALSLSNSHTREPAATRTAQPPPTGRALCTARPASSSAPAHATPLTGAAQLPGRCSARIRCRGSRGAGAGRRSASSPAGT